MSVSIWGGKDGEGGQAVQGKTTMGRGVRGKTGGQKIKLRRR